MQPKLTISILISRNYEGVKRCLDSVCPIMENVSSELILTDTGCGDKVRELIEGYSDHIIDFEWIKDFSAARNVGLKEAKGEWFLYVDDDEWFDDVSELINFFNSGECDKHNVAAYVQRNYLDMDGNNYGNHNVDRILRITPDLHFEGRVHEAYTGIEIGQKKRLSTFVHHYGYVYKSEEERIAKSKRNRELLRLECQEHPDDMRMRHQLVTDCYGLQEYDEAINVALEGIKIKSDSQYWDVLHTDILFCLYQKKDWKGIIQYGENFLNVNLFSDDEFGVRQYLICAYWSERQYDKVCNLASKVISTYIDYKKHPEKYDVNQLMRDDFWNNKDISKMLLFIIDSAIATSDEKIISLLADNNIREEMCGLISNDTYKAWLTQMMQNTCREESQIGLFIKLPMIDENNVDEFISHNDEVPQIEFKRLQFDSEFFEPETRDDFYIEPLVKNAWAAQLETLNMFDQICEANGLTYSLDWGTLLGAVRHKGFIPWDDDLDVCMPRKDLERFRDIVVNYPQVEFFDPYNCDTLGVHASRLILSRAFTVERDKLKDMHGFPFQVGIDIFSIDYVTRDKKKEEDQIALMLKINYAFNLLELIEQHDEKEDDYRNAFLEYIRDIQDATGIEFSQSKDDRGKLTALYDEVQGWYNRDEADYVSELPNIMVGKDYYLPIDTYDNIIRIPFENMMAPVPANYDEVLRTKYGEDYMTPVYFGSSHDYPFFNKDIRDLEEKRGNGSFDSIKEHIEKICSEYYRKFLNRNTEPTLHFEEEVLDRRDINRIDAALLETLAEIDRLCDAHGIKYYYVGETAEEIEKIKNFTSDSLDIHIAMRRMDYMNFQQILQEELDPWFDYRSIYSNPDHVDMKTYIITDAYDTNDGEYEARFHGCLDIVGVDLAPIDTVNDDDSIEELKRTVITQLLQTAPSMPAEPPYNEMILDIVRQYENMLGVSINTEGNLQNEFFKAADSVAMSDSDDRYGRVRISSDIADGIYN
ncbi:MAG: LicD family protein, partial [Lachnospiraceae bacterium]|nr:LicD family protein [Lachnospiraceae bacterium]